MTTNQAGDRNFIIKQTGNNDFNSDLEFSLDASLENFWDEVYEKAFPDMIGSEICKDIHWQKQGVDRVVYMGTGHSVHIDEKVRREVWPDILLEYLSNSRIGATGWINKPLSIDYLAYAFLPTKRVYLFPWPMLRRAWIEYKELWKGSYKKVRAQNHGYHTLSVAVPISELRIKVNNAMIIQLGKGPLNNP